MQTKYTSGTVFQRLARSRPISVSRTYWSGRRSRERPPLYYTLSPTYSVCKEYGYSMGSILPVEPYQLTEGIQPHQLVITARCRTECGNRRSSRSAGSMSLRCLFDFAGFLCPPRHQSARNGRRGQEAELVAVTATCPNCRATTMPTRQVSSTGSCTRWKTRS